MGTSGSAAASEDQEQGITPRVIRSVLLGVHCFCGEYKFYLCGIDSAASEDQEQGITPRVFRYDSGNRMESDVEEVLHQRYYEVKAKRDCRCQGKISEKP